MRIDEEVMRVASGTKDTLKTIINQLGGNVTDELIDEYPELAEDISMPPPDTIIEKNQDQSQKFWRGTSAQYEALKSSGEISADIMYIITDDDSGGGVTSVNGQTGTVVLNAEDVGAVPVTAFNTVEEATSDSADFDNLYVASKLTTYTVYSVDATEVERLHRPVMNAGSMISNGMGHVSQLFIPSGMTTMYRRRKDITSGIWTPWVRVYDENTKPTLADVGGSNPNLLDNPWFTVNQRGLTNAPLSGAMWVDRWFASSNVSVPLVWESADSAYHGVRCDGSNSNYRDIVQYLSTDTVNLLRGKRVTLSCMCGDGTVNFVTGTIPSALPTTDSTIFTDIEQLWLRYSASKSTLYFQLRFPANTSRRYQAAKLELGSVSTLANDVPPNYAEELAKCQRYCVRIDKPNGVGFAPTNSVVDVIIPLPVQMRVSPSLAASGGRFHVSREGNAGAVSCTVSSIIGGGQNSVRQRFSASNLVASSVYALNADSSGANDTYLIYTADL